MCNVTIHTDGSCLGNPGRGGWAAVLASEETGRREYSGGYRLTTNNRMEILAVIKALEALEHLPAPCIADVYTDSKYVCDSIAKGWLRNWQKRNWVKADRQPVLNVDLWRRLLPLLDLHTVRMHWLRGHAGHPENERCDQLAHAEASRPDLPPDTGYVP